MVETGIGATSDNATDVGTNGDIRLNIGHNSNSNAQAVLQSQGRVESNLASSGHALEGEIGQDLTSAIHNTCIQSCTLKCSPHSPSVQPLTS